MLQDNDGQIGQLCSVGDSLSDSRDSEAVYGQCSSPMVLVGSFRNSDEFDRLIERDPSDHCHTGMTA